MEKTKRQAFFVFKIYFIISAVETKWSLQFCSSESASKLRLYIC